MEIEKNIAMPPQNPKEKASFSLVKGDITFAICALIAGIFTTLFGIFDFALGMTVSIILMIALFTVYFARAGKIKTTTVIYGVLALSNSFVPICTSNIIVLFFSVIISILLLLLCFGEHINGSAKGNRQTLDVFCSAVLTVENIKSSVLALFSGYSGDRAMLKKIAIGAACSIPVLVVVVPLLISSDNAFQGMIDNIFSNIYITVLKAALGVLLATAIISYGFSLKSKQVSKIKYDFIPSIENAYVIPFLSIISACYALYLFSQLAYFFSAFRGFLPDGDITYAQYARKGFFEMCVIAVINLAIVSLVLLVSKKKNGKVSYAVRALATFVSAFTLVIIATAVSKMVLYIGTYGMTVLRLTTSTFMLFLSVVFITLISRIYATKINIIKTALVTAACILLVLGAVNVNAVCAKYNYEAYMLGRLNSVDISALYDLGDEGIPYIVRLAEDENEVFSKEARKHLASAYLYDYFDDMKEQDGFDIDELKQHRKNDGLWNFRLSRVKAYDALYEFIENNPDFGDACYEYIEEELYVEEYC